MFVRSLLSALFIATTATAVAVNTTTISNTTDSTDYTNLTVALIRAPPLGWPEPLLNKNYTGLHFDLNGTIAKGVALIEEAAANGANLAVFPELWFPGYPKGADDAWIEESVGEYIDNSLEIGSPEWEVLLAAAKDNSMYLALAYSEKTNSSIYMGQSIISKYGEVLLSRQKVRPSGGERSIWSDGSMDGLKVLSTPYGRWGILECWEHFHPTMTYNMQAQLEDLHIGSAPYTPDANDADALYWESQEVNSAAVRVYAVNSGAVTVWTGVGYAAVYSGGEGVQQAEMLAATPYDTDPILYHSINTTAFSTATYDVDGEQSWGVLQEIENAWPYYIPKVVGTYVVKKVNLISDLLSFNATA